jgi:hypothetical protein
MRGFRLFFIFCVLAIYSFGAGIMDSLAIYHSWRFVGEAEFARVHTEISDRIITFFVLPLLVCTILAVFLFWYRPASLPKKMVWMAMACLAVAWLSSVFIQIPIQFQLHEGKDVALLNKLHDTDWIRIIAYVAFFSVVISMLWRVSSKPVVV